MAYVGERFTACSKKFSVDPQTLEMVYVEGSGPNICGHVLLRFEGYVKGVFGTHYLHIPGIGTGRGGYAGFYDHPYYLNESGFSAYMRQTGKDILKKISVKFDLPASRKAKVEQKICSLASKPFAWGGLAHNCQSFVEQIINTGNPRFLDFTPIDCPAIDIKVHVELMKLNLFRNGRLSKNVLFIHAIFN